MRYRDILGKLLEANPHLGQVLYVGAKVVPTGRVPTMLRELRRRASSVVCLEASQENCEELREKTWFDKVIHADISAAIGSRHLGCYDTVVWWHGPEHVAFDLAVLNLSRLSCAFERVWIGCPWGQYPQGIVDGNPWEEHKTYLLPDDFTRLGYRVATCGKCHSANNSSHIVAWTGAPEGDII